MNSYNGYEPKQRVAAYAWLKKEWAAGRRQKTPKRCDVCFQEKGHLEYHSENYSFPFGDHIGEFGLCYICHMMIHCRFKSKESWNIYIKALEDKKQFIPFTGRSWYGFRIECLIGKFINLKYKIVEKNNVGILKKIDSGAYVAAPKDS